MIENGVKRNATMDDKTRISKMKNDIKKQFEKITKQINNARKTVLDNISKMFNSFNFIHKK